MHPLLRKLIEIREFRSIQNSIKTDLASRPKVPLTKEEKDAIYAAYKPFHLMKDFDYGWFEAYKYFQGKVEPQSIPEDFWKLYEYVLNPHKYQMIQHKGMLHRFLPKEILPVTLVNKMCGVSYDEEDNVISDEKAKTLLLKQKHFLYKPNIGTGGGKGLQEIDLSQKDNSEQQAILQDILHRDNFICQELLEGSNKMTRFNHNPRTVNTIRCITLLLNGKVSVVSSYLRMSAGDTVNDNVSFSTKTNLQKDTANCYVGIHPDGSLHEFGLCRIDRAKKFYQSPSGIVFKGEKLEFYERIKEKLVELHIRYLPLLGFIAWDVTLDENDNIRVIEINLNAQDIDDHHLFNGAVFANRFDELMKYIEKHNNPFRLLQY